MIPPYGVTDGIWQVGPKAWPGITAALLKMVVPGCTAARQVPAHHRQASSEFAYVSRPKQAEGPAVAPSMATLSPYAALRIAQGDCSPAAAAGPLCTACTQMQLQNCVRRCMAWRTCKTCRYAVSLIRGCKGCEWGRTDGVGQVLPQRGQRPQAGDLRGHHEANKSQHGEPACARQARLSSRIS